MEAEDNAPAGKSPRAAGNRNGYGRHYGRRSFTPTPHWPINPRRSMRRRGMAVELRVNTMRRIT